MGALVSYITSFAYGESDFNNNKIPDRKEVLDFVVRELDKKKEREQSRLVKARTKAIKKLLKR